MPRGFVHHDHSSVRPLTFRKRQTGIASLKHSAGLVRPAALVGIQWTFIDEKAMGSGGPPRRSAADELREIHGTLGDAPPEEYQPPQQHRQAFNSGRSQGLPPLGPHGRGGRQTSHPAPLEAAVGDQLAPAPSTHSLSGSLSLTALTMIPGKAYVMLQFCNFFYTVYFCSFSLFFKKKR
jgi:hypothetical protein